MYNLTDPRNAIRELQRYLLEISYATDGIPHLSVDGIYGPETGEAVRLFQLRNGLEPSGKADFATWQEVYRQFRAAREARTGRPVLLPPGSLPLALHARGSEVMVLQTLLAAMKEVLPDMPPVSQNGYFDAETQRALRAYQTYRRLPPSGILDEETWAFLARDYGARIDRARHAR